MPFNITAESSLEQIQEYMAQMTKMRGFDGETAQDSLLVLVEEVGELAKALRKFNGIGIDYDKLASYGNLKHEMADVLICLLILAHKCNINLAEGFCEKEEINGKRTWKPAQKILKSGSEKAE